MKSLKIFWKSRSMFSQRNRSAAILLLCASFPLFPQTHEDWSYNKVIYEVNVRQYTPEGTFAAFESHLERLQELGAGILWFMPVHPIGEQNRLGTLGSPYSVRDYMDINPEFGDLEDFKSLVSHIHSLGMYVIIDWVANHTSWDNTLTVSNPDWYTHDAEGNFQPPQGTNWTDVIQLDYAQQPLRDYMTDAMKFWVEETGIDGFRCDAVSRVPLDFWKSAIDTLKALKPDLFMLAEDDGTLYRSAGFDMTYAWGYHGFGRGVLNQLAGMSADADDLASYLTSEQWRFENDHYRMYFTSNHDENAWYGTVFEQFGDAAESFIVLTSLLDGMPLIYGGEEAGLDKRLLFFDKDQIPWKSHTFNDLYTTLFHLKRDHSALWNGERGGNIQRIFTTYDDNIYAFIREKDGDRIFALFNLSPGERDFSLQDAAASARYVDVFGEDTVSFMQNTVLSIPAHDYRVYRKIGDLTGIQKDGGPADDFSLAPSYPNPFNSNTKIRFSLPCSGMVEAVVYNTAGKKIRTLYASETAEGRHILNWDGRDEQGMDMPSGLYCCRVSYGKQYLTGKMMLLR